MRHYVLVGALVSAASLSGGIAAAQGGDQDSLRRVLLSGIEETRARTAAAAAVFLNRRARAAERLAAVRDVPSFVEPEQVAGAIATALNEGQPTAIRVRALQLAGHRVGVDSDFARATATLATTATLPVELRGEAVAQLAGASFALPPPAEEALRRTLRTAAQDPDLQIRRIALGVLASRGDEAGLALLSEGLTTPPRALLPPAEAVQLLGLVDPAPHYAVLRRVLREPPDAETRVAAIRLLGGDDASRAEIVRVLADARESPAIRVAAFDALRAGDPKNFPTQIVPVVEDESAPTDLRLRAITAVEIARTSRDPQMVSRAPDPFDRVMERLAAESTTPEVREAAGKYLTRTRSPR